MASFTTAATPAGEVTGAKSSKNAQEYTFTLTSSSTTNSQGYKGSMQDRFKQFRVSSFQCSEGPLQDALVYYAHSCMYLPDWGFCVLFGPLS